MPDKRQSIEYKKQIVGMEDIIADSCDKNRLSNIGLIVGFKIVKC